MLRKNEIKVSDMGITVPKGSAFACETPPNAPKLHMLCAVVARRGGGKGVITAALIERLKVVDRLICVSPSASSNKVLLDRFKNILAPEDIFKDVSDINVHDKVIAIVEEERDLLEEYRTKLKLWESAMKKIRSTNSLFSIPEDELLAFGEGKPKHKWNGRVPCLMVWYDDVVGSNCMMGRGARKLANFALMHRHTGAFKEGGAVGISMIFNVQSYKTYGSIPRAVRNNLTCVLLGRVTSEKDLRSIYEEMAGEISEDVFYRLYEQAVGYGPHQFFFLDMHPKPNHPSAYRRGLDTFLLP